MQDSNPIMDALVDGAVNEVHINKLKKTDSESKKDKYNELLYGTDNGIIGTLKLNASGIRRGWQLPPDRKGIINCIDTFDLTKDGVADIIIGRDDGSLQVYGFDLGREAERQFNENIGESVRSICAGVVISPEFDEIIVATYGGRVTSFTSEPMNEKSKADAYGRTKGTVQREENIVKIRKEIEKLKTTIEKEKVKLGADPSESNMLLNNVYKVNSNFALVPEIGGYIVSVEIPMPIDVVTLQSTVPLDLLEVESNAAIVSRSQADPSKGNASLATYRCNEITNRLEFKVRTVEGQYGDIQALIVAKLDPKSAQLVRFSIKPLSLHYRILDYTPDRLLNTLKFTGTFTAGQMHDFVCKCLPDIPPRANETEVSMCFKNGIYINIFKSIFFFKKKFMKLFINCN